MIQVSLARHRSVERDDMGLNDINDPHNGLLLPIHCIMRSGPRLFRSVSIQINYPLHGLIGRRHPIFAMTIDDVLHNV
jgi:hypothetical protein